MWTEAAADEQALHTVGGIQVLPYTPHESNVSTAYFSDRTQEELGDKFKIVEEFKVSSESLFPTDPETDHDYGALKKTSVGDFRASTQSLPPPNSPQVLSPPQDLDRQASSVTPKKDSGPFMRNPSKYKVSWFKQIPRILPIIPLRFLCS